MADDVLDIVPECNDIDDNLMHTIDDEQMYEVGWGAPSENI